MNCLERGPLWFPVWLFFIQPPGIFFFFKQTRRLKKSCHPRRRHAFSNPPVWERSQLDEQREGPHVWDQRREVNVPVWLRPGERGWVPPPCPAPTPSSGAEPILKPPLTFSTARVGPKGVGENDLPPSWRPLIYSFNRQPGSAKHCRPLKD